MLRREVHDMIGLAERLLAAGEIGVLATLFSSRGSTYRPLGSMMVAGPGSLTAGAVSGGCLEEYIARHGRLLVQESSACMLSFDADPDVENADKPKLGCGGSIEVLVERLTARHVDFLREFAAAHERDFASFATCKIVVAENSSLTVERTCFTPSTGNPGEGGGDGSGDSQSRFRNSRTLLWRGRGDEQTLLHRVEPMTRLVILGAGDDVKPLSAVAMSLGWHVTVVDRRLRRASRQRFPEVDQLIAAEWDEAIKQIAFSPRTAVVMMTHSLADDITILPLLLEKPMAYFGALGPAHRRQWVIDGALATASLPGEFLERFKGPIGLDLGERSPAGIAVAIVAEITAALNERSARRLWDLARRNSSPPRFTLHG